MFAFISGRLGRGGVSQMFPQLVRAWTSPAGTLTHQEVLHFLLQLRSAAQSHSPASELSSAQPRSFYGQTTLPGRGFFGELSAAAGVGRSSPPFHCRCFPGRAGGSTTSPAPGPGAAYSPSPSPEELRRWPPQAPQGPA